MKVTNIVTSALLVLFSTTTFAQTEPSPEFTLAAALVYSTIFGCLSGMVGWLIAKGKGRGTFGFWMGFFLGPIGWFAAGMANMSEEEEIKRAARLRSYVDTTLRKE